MDAKATLIAIGNNIAGLATFMNSLFMIIGFALVCLGMYWFGIAGLPTAKVSRQAAFLASLMGGVMVAESGWLTSLSQTILADKANPVDLLAYTPPAAASEFVVMLSVVVALTNLIGYYAVLRGTYHMATLEAAARRNGPGFWTAVTFLFFGTIGANFMEVLDVLAASAGHTNPLRDYL